MAIETSPAFMQNETYGAEITRRALYWMLQRDSSGDIGSISGGVVSTGDGDLLVSAPSSGMSVNIAPGEAIVPGTSVLTQSGYYMFNDATVNVAVAAADATNPRIDLVCATIEDAYYSGSNNDGVLAVETGTPTPGATLANLSGAPSLPASSLALAYLLVPANSTSVTTGNLLDARPALTLSASTASAELRSVSATVTPGESTVFDGSTESQTLTLPSDAASGTLNTIVNTGSVAVSISGGTGSISGYSSGIVLEPGMSAELTLIGTTWYVLSLTTAPSAEARSVSATVAPGEFTVFDGSEDSQTLTLPSEVAVSGTLNTIVNAGSVAVSISGGGTGTISGYSSGIDLQPGASVELVLIVPAWYVTVSPTPLFPAEARSVSATVAPGEATIFEGSTASQTLTLPSDALSGTLNTIVNTASVAVTISGGTGSISGYSSGIVLQAGASVELVLSGSTWYVTVSPTASVTPAELRSASATVTEGESTVFDGSTASQTLTLPTDAVSGTINRIVNAGSVTVTISGGTGSISGYSSGIVLQAGASVELTFLGSTWYVLSQTSVNQSQLTTGGFSDPGMDGSPVEMASMTLNAGMWYVMAQAEFSITSDDDPEYYMNISTISGADSSGKTDNFGETTFAQPSNDAAWAMHVSGTVALTASTTIYVNGYAGISGTSSVADAIFVAIPTT